MSQSVYPVPESVKANALIDEAKYQELYQWSIDDPAAFWQEQGKRLDWITPFSKVKKYFF